MSFRIDSPRRLLPAKRILSGNRTSWSNNSECYENHGDGSLRTTRLSRTNTGEDGIKIESKSERPYDMHHRFSRGDIREDFEAAPTFSKRLEYLLDRKELTDVVFKIGSYEHILEAHRLVLAAASSKFQAILYDENPSLFGNKILIKDPEHSVTSYTLFLQALYTDEIPVNLTFQLAIELFYLSKKYGVKFLETKILDHVISVITISNVFEALRLSTESLEFTGLVAVCWKIIEEQTFEVLQYHLENLDPYMMIRILDRDQLNLEEIELFQIVLKWASLQCKKKGLKATGKNKRQMMEPLLKHIRFTTIPSAPLQKIVSTSRILMPEEMTSIMSHVTRAIDKHPVPYNLNLRQKPKSLSATKKCLEPTENITEENLNQMSSLSSSDIPEQLIDADIDELCQMTSDTILSSAGKGSTGSSKPKRGQTATKKKVKKTTLTSKIRKGN